MNLENLSWKIIERPLLPIEGSSVDAFPFLALAALLFLSGCALKNKKLGLRAISQSISFIFFIFAVHRCFGAIRGWIYGIQEIAGNDIGVFYNLLVFVPLVSFSVIFGRVFCGWVCPLGALQELAFRMPVLKKLQVNLSLRAQRLKFIVLAFLFIFTVFLLFKLRPKTFFFVENIAAFWGLCLMLLTLIVAWKPHLDSRLKKIRSLSLILWIGLIIMDVYVTDPWCVLYGNVVDYSSIISLLAVLVSAIFISMPWCRYMCPVGSFLGKMAGVMRLEIRQKIDLSPEKISQLCPVEALGKSSIDRSSCLYCARCIQAKVSEIEES